MFRITTTLILVGVFLWPQVGFAEEKKGEKKFESKFHENHNKVIHLDEVVVSVPMEESIASSAKPVNIMTGDELTEKISSTLGETLKQEPGVHSSSFGPGVGLPVIRGQSGPRVRVLNNGLGANDASQLSPDHATGVMPLLADRIEVLRGPATLLYGSGAIGGVVNVIDNRIPDHVPDKIINGTLEQRFNTVSDERATTVKLDGGKDHVAFHFDGFHQERGNIDIGGTAIDVGRASVSEPDIAVTQNTEGFINNTGSDSIGGSAGFSLVGEDGFFGISGSTKEDNYGIPPKGTADGERVTIEQEQIKLGMKGEVKTPVSFLKSVRVRMNFTEYEHREIAEGEAENRFTSDTIEGRLEMPHQPIGPFEGVIGFQAIANEFGATEIGDNASLVPVSQNNSYGFFAIEEFDLGPVETQVGVRVERATLDPKDYRPFKDYTPVSASLSGLWQANDQNTFKLAFTRSERAPQIQELFFNGVHEATSTFQSGNPNLGLETSYNVDLGYQLMNDWVTVKLDLFNNYIEDYIFWQRSGIMIEDVPQVISRQFDANFMGYEARMIFPLMDNRSGLVDLTLFSDYTRGRLLDRGDVPQQPPLRWGFQLDYLLDELSTSFVLTRGEQQNLPGAFESNTSDYTLLNLSAHYHITELFGNDVMVFAKANNLLNENIRNSTSFLRNFAPEPGRGIVFGVRGDF